MNWKNKKTLLRTCLKMKRKLGEERAKCERDYKVLLNKEVFKLREQGLAIGMIDKICYGVPEVAQARYRRDVADATYEANQEAILVYKLELKLIEEQIEREWSASK